VVTHDVSGDTGQLLHGGDRYRPVTTWLHARRSLVGGLLPPGAVSAEVVDERGERVGATVDSGAYAVRRASLARYISAPSPTQPARTGSIANPPISDHGDPCRGRPDHGARPPRAGSVANAARRVLLFFARRGPGDCFGDEPEAPTGDGRGRPLLDRTSSPESREAHGSDEAPSNRWQVATPRRSGRRRDR
jgi:hypothetical protein